MKGRMATDLTACSRAGFKGARAGQRPVRRDRGGGLVAALPPPAAEDRGRGPGAAGSTGRSRSPATAGGCPASGPQTRHDLWFGHGFVHAQDRLWQCDLHRRVSQGRLSEIAGQRRPAGGPPDADARDRAASRAARGARARLPSCARCWRPTARASTRRRRGPGALPAEFQILRLDFEPWRPADMPRRRQAARLRALDQLGARAAARRPRPRAGPRARGEDRPGLSGAATRS